MKTATLVMCVVIWMVGCGKEQAPAAQASLEVKAAESVDFRQLAMLTMATITRSSELFAKLGDSDKTVYYREIYNPTMQAVDAWPKIIDPEYKNVPEALWDCREAAVFWLSYLDRVTMTNPPEFVVAEAKKDLANVREKTRLCDAASK